MTPNAALLFPPKALASCVSAAVFRDTVGVPLAAGDRLNYFPASPLFTVTRVFEGSLHMAAGLSDITDLRRQPAMPRTAVVRPQNLPTCSWSPASLRALTVAIYPDAWMKLGGSEDGVGVPRPIADGLTQEWTSLQRYWLDFCDALSPRWSEVRQGSKGWHGSHRVSDWARHVTTHAALGATGRSLRTLERHLRRLTGQSRQSIDFFAKIEELHAARIADPDAPLAEIAVASDFSDQSHMGRAVKRVTGFPPAELNRRIETEEPFWCYRLLGERF